MELTMKYLFRSIAFSSLVLFAGCGERHESKKPVTPTVELMYWPAPNTQEIQLADSIVARWNRLHLDIHVRMQPIPVSQSTEEVLLAAIAGKTTPDVCSNIWPGALHDYTESGGLVPLDTFSDFDSLVSSRTPSGLIETFRSDDGHCYQFPWKTNPVMMFYNLRLLREAGVEQVPRTYSEYFAAAKKISRDTTGDGEIDIWMGDRDIRPIWWQRLFDFYPLFIAASNGSTLFEKNKIAFENAGAVSAMWFFQECYSKQFYPRTFIQAGDLFDLEKKATHISGPWQVAHIEKFVPQMNYAVAPVPVPDDHVGPVYTAGDFKNIAIFSNTTHPTEAWEFVKFLVTSEHDLMLLEICNQIPVRPDLKSNILFADYFHHNPVMLKFAEQAPYTRGMDAQPDLKEIFDAISQEYEACAVFGRKSPARAIHDAAVRTKAIVEWNQ